MKKFIRYQIFLFSALLFATASCSLAPSEPSEDFLKNPLYVIHEDGSEKPSGITMKDFVIHSNKSAKKTWKNVGSEECNLHVYLENVAGISDGIMDINFVFTRRNSPERVTITKCFMKGKEMGPSFATLPVSLIAQELGASMQAQ